MARTNPFPIAAGFCPRHLRCVLACTDSEIERALTHLPAYDLDRLRKLLGKPAPGGSPRPAAGSTRP